MLSTNQAQYAAERSAQHAHLATSGIKDGEDPERNTRSDLFVDGTVGKDRKILARGTLYASGAMRSGTETFWAINSGSLLLCCRGVDVMRWPAVAVAH